VALPPHFQAERVGEVWRVPYEERAREAGQWAREHRIRPAAEDRFRVCLVAVDVQNTFCTPGFELFVPGAVEDSRRLCEFVYRNLAVITEIVPTLDTHQAIQIFHAAFLVDAGGNRPDPYTLVSTEDVESGRWQIDPELGLDPGYLLRYTRELEAGGRYRLTVWPYHAMLGGIGHALVSSVEEAFFFHAITRRAAPAFEIKGFNPLTEHYSVLGPEVMGEKNEELICCCRSTRSCSRARPRATAWPGRSTTCCAIPTRRSSSWRGGCTCSRPAPLPGSFRGSSTTRRRRTTPSGASQRPG